MSYAYKKDTATGERHGSLSERVLAYNRPNSNTILANASQATTTTVKPPPIPSTQMPPPPKMPPPPMSMPPIP